MSNIDIVFEGPDNTGKSTLIKKLTRALPWEVIRSEGPERFPGEIDIRITSYLVNHSRGVIYDRHPAISEGMYAFMRNAPGPSQLSMDRFYATSPLIIYCRPAEGRDLLEGHVVNPEVDTEEHLRLIRNNFSRMWSQYDDWALQRAHFLYRIGDDDDRLIKGILGVINALS